jgi:hypothetical protein
MKTLAGPLVVLTLTAGYGIGRLFGLSYHLAILKRRRLKRGHRWQLVHDRPEQRGGARIFVFPSDLQNRRKPLNLLELRITIG